MTITEPMQDYGRLKFLVNDSWIDSSSEEVHDTYNPATGRVIARVPFASREEVNGAVEAAQNAFESWRRLPISDRARYLFRMKDVMERHFDELAAVNTQNHGKTFEESRGDIARAIENIDAAIAAAFTLAKGDSVDQVTAGIDVAVSKEPLGVFSLICPFNFPIMVPFWFIPYAVVLGDTIVVKPSEITPVPMQLLARLLRDEAGLPKGVLNVLHGSKEVVEALIAHRDVKGVTFVGSTPVARQVYKLAGENGKRAIANGGAKNSIVVMPDADINQFMPSALVSFFGNTGQRCLSGANLVFVGSVHDSLLRRFADAASKLKIGYGLEEGVEMGPLVSVGAKRKVSGFVDVATSEGAKIVLDGRNARVPKYPDGFYFGATVLDDVTPNMRVSKEEIFGPVASVLQTETLDEAVDVINSNTNFGNGACIYTSSGRTAREFRSAVDVGNVGINLGVPAPVAHFPFGGRRDSFYGVLHPQIDTTEFFTDKKIAVSRW